MNVLYFWNFKIPRKDDMFLYKACILSGINLNQTRFIKYEFVIDGRRTPISNIVIACRNDDIKKVCHLLKDCGRNDYVMELACQFDLSWIKEIE